MTAHLHPRETVVRLAQIALRDKLADWYREYPDLTIGEVLSVVGGVLSDDVKLLARNMIRTERHPDDPDKLGGFE